MNIHSFICKQVVLWPEYTDKPYEIADIDSFELENGNLIWFKQIKPPSIDGSNYPNRNTNSH